MRQNQIRMKKSTKVSFFLVECEPGIEAFNSSTVKYVFFPLAYQLFKTQFFKLKSV